MSLRSSVANGGGSKAQPSSAPGQEKQKQLLESDSGHFSMIKALHLADAITCMNCKFPSLPVSWPSKHHCMLVYQGNERVNTYACTIISLYRPARATGPLKLTHGTPGFCGFNSILSSLRYCLGPADNYTNIWIALWFVPFGLFFDFMDGKVARWRGKSSLMGQELDSLADLVRLFLLTLPTYQGKV